MKYNFDELITRRGTASVKWDFAVADDVLPMWVADMDFRTAQPVIDALHKRAEHGVFGYAVAPPRYFEAVCGWFRRRYDFSIKTEWILPTIGIVPALLAILRALTQSGDRVILQSPVYDSFFSSIARNNLELLSNDLIYKDGRYSVNFEELESMAADPRAKVFMLCNPHNPAGRCWSREELQRMGDICIRNGVTILSDEIHCDLTDKAFKHTPFGSLGATYLQHSVTCTSPSKTFNLAGVQGANIIVADETTRLQVQEGLAKNGIDHQNVFGIEAVTAAYNEGEEWLNQLLDYLHDNYLFVKDFIAKHLPMLTVIPLEATYLVWLDCSALSQTSQELSQRLLDEGSLWLNPGIMYGSNSDRFLRLNIACPRKRLEDGLNRMKKIIANC